MRMRQRSLTVIGRKHTFAYGLPGASLAASSSYPYPLLRAPQEFRHVHRRSDSGRPLRHGPRRLPSLAPAGLGGVEADPESVADAKIRGPLLLRSRGRAVTAEDFEHLARWFERVKQRPATERAYARAAEINNAPVVDEAARKVLFGQDASVVR